MQSSAIGIRVTVLSSSSRDRGENDAKSAKVIGGGITIKGTSMPRRATLVSSTRSAPMKCWWVLRLAEAYGTGVRIQASACASAHDTKAACLVVPRRRAPAGQWPRAVAVLPDSGWMGGLLFYIEETIEIQKSSLSQESRVGPNTKCQI